MLYPKPRIKTDQRNSSNKVQESEFIIRRRRCPRLGTVPSGITVLKHNHGSNVRLCTQALCNGEELDAYP